MMERAWRGSGQTGASRVTPESNMAFVICDADSGAAAPKALALDSSVSVFVSGGVAQRSCNVASPSDGSVSAVFALCLRDRAVLLSLTYWRRFQAVTREPTTIPVAENASMSASMTARGSHNAAAMRRDGISMLPPSLMVAAFSSIRCHAATETEREQPATIAASANLGSVTVPS